MTYGAIFNTEGGAIQIDQTFATLRVIESGVIADNTSVSFARASGSLYVRPTNYGAYLYLSSDRTKIRCSSGTITYIVLQNASNYSISSGYGLKVVNGSNVLVFSDEMPFPKLRYSSLVSGIKTAPLTLNLNNIYPNSNPYIYIFSLGLDKWQIGQSYVTYWNIKATFNSQSEVVIDVFQTQTSSTVNGYNWGDKNTYTIDIQNHIQIITV